MFAIILEVPWFKEDLLIRNYPLCKNKLKQKLQLVNDLGIDLGKSPEEISNLENKNFNSVDIDSGNKSASDNEYKTRIRDVNASSPARFNADSRRLYGASGCAKRLLSLR